MEKAVCKFFGRRQVSAKVHVPPPMRKFGFFRGIFILQLLTASFAGHDRKEAPLFDACEQVPVAGDNVFFHDDVFMDFFGFAVVS